MKHISEAIPDLSELQETQAKLDEAIGHVRDLMIAEEYGEARRQLDELDRQEAASGGTPGEGAAAAVVNDEVRQTELKAAKTRGELRDTAGPTRPGARPGRTHP